jgi:hypothetical protein
MKTFGSLTLLVLCTTAICYGAGFFGDNRIIGWTRWAAWLFAFGVIGAQFARAEDAR